jgi:hypothetical protein
MVRCTSCGHRWFVAHEEEFEATADETPFERGTASEPDLAISATRNEAAPLDRAPGIGIESGFTQNAVQSVKSRSTTATIGWLSLLLTLLILTGLVLGRNEIVSLAPHAASVYQRLGLPVTQAIGLELAGIVSERLRDAGTDTLRISGTVRNVAGAERQVPPLRIALLDGGRAEVMVREVEVPQGVLGDGASTRFVVDLDDPPDSARNFSVTFAVAE